MGPTLIMRTNAVQNSGVTDIKASRSRAFVPSHTPIARYVTELTAHQMHSKAKGIRYHRAGAAQNPMDARPICRCPTSRRRMIRNEMR